MRSYALDISGRRRITDDVGRPNFRRFVLDRIADVSGVSGTGVVAEGVVFSDGTAVLRWLGELTSSAMYNSIDHIMAIHGHGGATKLAWID